MALYDEIQARLRKQATDLNGMAPATGTQAALTDAAQAGTGRAQTSGAPAASNVGEQVQAAAGQAQTAQVAARLDAAADRLSQSQQSIRAAADAGAAKLAANQTAFDASQTAGANARAITRAGSTDSLAASLKGQETRGLASATQQFVNKSADVAAEGATARDDIFAGFKQGTQELAFRKDGAQLEQLASQLALQDRSYVDTLNQIGTLRRLDDDSAWRSELQRLTLGDKLDSALKSSKFQVDLNADQRAWNEQMSSMDYDTAMLVLSSEMKSKNTAQIIQGVGGLASVAGKKYQTSQNMKGEGDPTADAAPSEDVSE